LDPKFQRLEHGIARMAMRQRRRGSAYSSIADQLNNRGVPPPPGDVAWSAATALELVYWGERRSPEQVSLFS